MAFLTSRSVFAEYIGSPAILYCPTHTSRKHVLSTLWLDLRAGSTTTGWAGARATGPTVMSLPRRPLGSTGLHASVLGFGGSPLGGVFRDVPEEVAVASVQEAFRLGINFFDTSPYYASTKSEAVLGKALEALPRDQVIVATKVGRYGPDIADFDFSADRVTRSVRESLERLRMPYIDIIQCHDVEFGDLDQVARETIPALIKLKEAGLVRHIGVTGLPFKALRHVLDRVPPGSVETVLSYCHYCLNDTTLVNHIPYFQAKGLGVINASPFSMGLLTDAGPPAWHPAPPALKAAAARAAALSRERGVDLPRLALTFAVRNESIATTLVGMSEPEEVRANVRATLGALGLGEGLSPELETELSSKVLGELADVRDVTWPSGRPENN